MERWAAYNEQFCKIAAVTPKKLQCNYKNEFSEQSTVKPLPPTTLAAGVMRHIIKNREAENCIE